MDWFDMPGLNIIGKCNVVCCSKCVKYLGKFHVTESVDAVISGISIPYLNSCLASTRRIEITSVNGSFTLGSMNIDNWWKYVIPLWMEERQYFDSLGFPTYDCSGSHVNTYNFSAELYLRCYPELGNEFLIFSISTQYYGVVFSAYCYFDDLIKNNGIYQATFVNTAISNYGSPYGGVATVTWSVPP